MLDEVLIFSKTGLVLFRRTFTKPCVDAMAKFIQTVLLDSRQTSSKTFYADRFALRYVINNECGIVVVVVYQKLLAPVYIDYLVNKTCKTFVRMFKEDIGNACGMLDFDASFERILNDIEGGNELATADRSGAASGNVEHSSKQTTEDGSGESGHQMPENALDEVLDMMASLDTQQSYRSRKTPGAYQAKNKAKSDATKKKSSKEKRNWEERSYSSKDAAKYDANSSNLSEGEIEQARLAQAKKYLPETGFEASGLDFSEDEEDDEESWFGQSYLGSLLAKVSGRKPLTREDLTPQVDSLAKKLQSKNVSSAAVVEICEAVFKDMENVCLGSFTRTVDQAVRESCYSALQRILSPKKPVEVLHEANLAKAKGRPYVIVFVGVNGVGKTTTNGKLCYYLKQNGLKVLMAACDTFRSGAVEQLKTHSVNLGLELFEQGYNKDASLVASNAIKYAVENNIDVVTIDTAGRMQNNEPLMRALAKLVGRNKPDLVLFVGDALVGNDGYDQLTLFNKALVDYSDSRDPRQIDGIVLTKFDTIGEKMGTAVSLVHSTGQPIIFVGTGERYTNLKRLNVSKVLKALLAP